MRWSQSRVRTTAALALAVIVVLGASAPTRAAETLDPAARIAALNAAVAEVEAAMQSICRRADAGQLHGRVVVTVGSDLSWREPARIAVTPDNLDVALDAALELIDAYEREKAELRQIPQAGVPEKLSRADQLRQTEVTAGDARLPKGAPAFNLYDDFSSGVRERQAARAEMAEADMRRVAEERNLAAEQQRVIADRDRRVAEANRRWQAELDEQAARAAEAEAAWKRKYSVAGFAKNLSRTVVSGAVTGLAGGIGSGLADMMVRDMFDNDGGPPRRDDKWESSK